MSLGRAAGQIFLLCLILDIRWGAVISRLKHEDTWNFHQVLIGVFHRGGVGNEVELVLRWWDNSGGTWSCFSEVQHQKRLSCAISTVFWGKVGQVFPRLNEENKVKEQIADPHPLSSVPAGGCRGGKREKQELGVCSGCWCLLLSFLRNIPGNGSQCHI